MKFHSPLVKGTLVKRYKRFMADVTLEDGTVVTAHCANSGSMLSVNEPGSEVWISPAQNPDRKLKWTWELIRIGKTLVGINTSLPNAIVAEAIEAGKIPELTGYESLRREVKYGKNSRIDILLEAPDKAPCYVEIKNVTMRRDLKDGPLEFPDGVTSRGAKHLVELADMVAEGHRAVMLYLVQREDGERFEIAGDIDPTYAEGLVEARKKGIEVLCYRCKVTPKDISVSDPVPVAP
jgi:sugar fermentation stimulation protein A